MARCRQRPELESPCGGSRGRLSSARQAENMLQSIVSCQRQRDKTRRDALARRAIFVSSFKPSVSRDVSSRLALQAICLRHYPSTNQNKTKPRVAENCGGRTGSGDLVIDEANQATGKRVFPLPLGVPRIRFPGPVSPTPTPIPTSKSLRRTHRQATAQPGVSRMRGWAAPKIAPRGEFCRSDGVLK